MHGALFKPDAHRGNTITSSGAAPSFGPSDVQRGARTRLLFEAQRQGVKEEYVSHLLSELGFERITFTPATPCGI